MTDNTDNGLDTIDLRPCLLLALDVSRRGGQSYTREGEVVERLDDGGLKATWTTKKVLNDENEYTEATRLQGQAKRAAGKLGRHTPVGVVVPLDRKSEVKAYREEWREVIGEFNGRSKYSKLNFTAMVFKITGENISALEAVVEDLRDGLNELEAAYKSMEPQAMRDVIAKMAGFTEILPERASFLVDEAIEEARNKAKAVSRATSKMSKIETKIAEVLGPDADIEAELKRLSAERLSASLRMRVRNLSELAAEKKDAIEALEATKARINDTPIRLARFAVRRPGTPAEQVDSSANLNAARVAARFASTPAT